MKENKDISKSNRKKRRFVHDIAANPIAYLMGLPAILYALIFGYLTYPYMIIAFQRFSYKTGIFGSEFVGLKNFEFFFKSTQVYTITFNTIKLNLLFIIFTTIVALLLALGFNELRSKTFIRVNQAAIMFPNYLSWVVVSFMIYSLFSTNYGLINQMLTSLGAERIVWYNNADYWPSILTIMRVWKGAGMNSIIYMATIASIDESFVEAAKIDGAKRWQICRHITLPLLMPTVSIMTLLSIGGIMYGDFGMIYAIVGDNGVLLRTTDVIDTYMYRALRKLGDPSSAMAIGLIQSIVGFIMVFGSNALARKLNPDAALY